jgi:molecular chaperone GrpE (heat shock protein)
MKEEDISNNSEQLEVKGSADKAQENKMDLEAIVKENEEIKKKNEDLEGKMDFLKRQVAATVDHFKSEFKMKSDALKRDRANMLKSMIKPFQELVRAINSEQEEERIKFLTSLKENIELIIRDNDGEVINPKVGDEFNTHEHKVLAKKQVESGEKSARIHVLHAPGIKMGDRILIPANVTISIGG